MTPVLHIEPRPFTSPCAWCAAEIPLEQTVSLADESRDTVCDGCGKRADPAAFAALAVLRAADDGWWRLAGPGAPIPGERLNEATAYLWHVITGLAVIAEWYGAPEPERALTCRADPSELASYPQKQPSYPQ